MRKILVLAEQHANFIVNKLRDRQVEAPNFVLDNWKKKIDYYYCYDILHTMQKYKLFEGRLNICYWFFLWYNAFFNKYLFHFLQVRHKIVAIISKEKVKDKTTVVRPWEFDCISIWWSHHEIMELNFRQAAAVLLSIQFDLNA